ncbi:MAG: hemerythrin family protein [Hungatella sp.]|nr:hemerythrin family protein [Hungatella sp.]
MSKLVWNEQLNIGVEVVDQAHANLFRMVGKLTELSKNKAKYQNACKEGLRYLEDYTMRHFSEEEAYMRSIRYKGYARHKEIHDIFRDQTLVSLKKTLESTGYSQAATARFLGVLLGWLTGHIMTEDQNIMGKTSVGRIYDHSSETEVAAQAVCHAMEDVFHIRAKLADAAYDGRNMGMGFFCRLCYNTDDGGKVQILLGVEEQLLRRGAGLLLGFHAMQDISMVHQVSLQIFEQFLQYMGKLFKSDSSYTLYKEELLTCDEFRSDFMTRYPCSMLFETRLGHFVFCYRQWESRKKKSSSQLS